MLETSETPFSEFFVQVRQKSRLISRFAVKVVKGSGTIINYNSSILTPEDFFSRFRCFLLCLKNKIENSDIRTSKVMK